MFSDVWVVILKFVKCVTRYGLWFGRMASPMGCSVQYCCSKYGFTVDDMPKVSGRSIVKHYIHRVDPAVIVRVRMLLELIFIRNGLFYLNMPDFDIQFLISQLCIMRHFFSFFFYVYFVYDDIINI